MPNSSISEKMNSLNHLLSEEGFDNFFKTTTQVKLCDESKISKYICDDNKTFDSSFNYNIQKPTSVPEIIPEDHPAAATDEIAVRAVISILGGYVGRYAKDLNFQKTIQRKCKSCLVTRRKDLDDDDGSLANLDLGIESTDKLIVEEQGTSSSKKTKKLLKVVASVNSKKPKNGSTCGIPNSHISACAQLYLSIVYKLEKKDRISARHLLQVFSHAPFLARTHLLPHLWDHIFLPHLLHLKIWYNKELEILSSYGFDKERKIKALTNVYNNQVDMGTVQFSLYYIEWLKVGTKPPFIPSVPLPSRPSYATSRRTSLDSFTSNSSIPPVPLPSRPSYATSRRTSLDSFTSNSPINKNLYRAVFGHTLEQQQLDSQIKDSTDEFCSKQQEKSQQRSSSENCIISGNELWRDRSKSDYFRFLSCQSVVSECLVRSNQIVTSNSVKNTGHENLPLSNLSKAISTICSSNILTDCEIAIRAITKAWLDSQGNPVIGDALTKASVIEGMLDVLLASEDDEILELAISILAELVSRNKESRLIILNSDPQLETFMRLLKSSSLFLKAAVLLYYLKPKAKQMVSIEWVALALRVLEFGDQMQTLFTVRRIPQKAAMYFLNQLLTGFSEDRNLENAGQVVSLGGLSLLVRIFEKGEIVERNNAAMLMCCCIHANDSCRNYLADNLDKTALLELIALGIQNKSTGFALDLLTELLCISRRTQVLTQLNIGWSGLNTKHIFLVYLQRALPEERPIIAAILLQLDLLGDPLKSSLYREDAIEAIIEALDYQICNLKIQPALAKALLMLGGNVSNSGELKSVDWPLYDTDCAERSMDLYSLNEEEKAVEDWQRRVAIVLLNSGSKRFLSALSNSIANGTQTLAQSSLFTVSWMNRVLFSVEDETLKHLIRSSECASMLSRLDKELIDPLRNPPCHG